MNEKIIKITLETETYKQTLKGEDAEKWFNAMSNMLHGEIPTDIVMAKWKKRKKQK